jgi:hypothetical protein
VVPEGFGAALAALVELFDVGAGGGDAESETSSASLEG